MKKIIAGVLTFCIILALMPAIVLAAPAEVTIAGEGITLFWEKYVVFEYHGERLRSDQLTPKFNQMLWEKLSNADRKKLTSSYNIYYRDLKEHFGKESADNICKWNREYTGWSEAGRVWRSRIGAREFSALTAYFTRGEGRAFLNAQTAAGASPTLAQWVEYQRLRQDFESLFASGVELTAKLTKFKSEEIATRFSAASGELVKMIMDNALLTKPSGDLAVEGAKQFLSYTASLLNIKERIINWTVGEDMLTVDKAKLIIDALEEAVRLHEQMANTIQSECLSLKTSLEAAYQALLAANDSYNQSAEEQKAAIETATGSTIAAFVEPLPPSIPQVPNPQNPDEMVEPKPNSAEAYQALLAAYNAAAEVYDSWAELVPAKKQSVINTAAAKLCVYQWPQGANMSNLPAKSPGEMLRTDLNFFNFNRDLSASVDAAISCNNANISAWEEYRAACEGLLSGETAYFKDTVEPALQGVRAYITDNVSAAGNNYYYQYQALKDSVNAKLGSGTVLLESLASMQIRGDIYLSAGYNKTYANGIGCAIDEEKMERTYLTENKKAWENGATTALELARRDAAEYRELQNNYDIAFDFVLAQDAEFNRLENELSALEWYAVQTCDIGRGFLTVNPSTNSLNSVLMPLFDTNNFKGTTGEINWKARTARIREYADILHEYGVNMRKAADGVRAGLQQCDFYAAAMGQIIGNSTGGSNNYLKNLNNINASLKSVWEIQLKHGEATRDYFNLLSPPQDSRFLKLNIMMRDLYGNSYDFLRLREIKAALDEERADIMRLTGNDFTARITHYKNMANFSGYSPIPAYQGTPMTMVNTRSFTWDEAAEFYYMHFWGSGDGVIGDMERKKSSGFVPAQGLKPFGEANQNSFPLMSAADGYDLSLNVGESYDLAGQIYVLPQNATEQGIFWDSSDYAIADVDENGMVAGISDGIVTITARALDAPSQANGEGFTQTVVFKVGAGIPKLVWNIAQPVISSDAYLDTVTATTSLEYCGKGEEGFLCVLALYHNDNKGKMIGLSAYNIEFDELSDGEGSFSLSVTCPMPVGANEADFTAKILRLTPISFKPKYDVME